MKGVECGCHFDLCTVFLTTTTAGKRRLGTITELLIFSDTSVLSYNLVNDSVKIASILNNFVSSYIFKM